MDLFSQNLNQRKKYRCFEPFISKGYKGIYYIYYFHPEKETRTKKSTKSKNQREAINQLTRFKTNYYKGTKDERIKYVSDLKDAIMHYYKESHSYKTLELYTTSFKKFISVNGNMEISQVTKRSIEDFKIKVAKVSSKNTANIYLRTLKSAFNFGVNYGFLYENPFSRIKQFQIPEKQKLSFEPNEMRILFESIEQDFLKRIVTFAYYSGNRIGEILNLQWKDIDQTKNLIHISNKNDFLTKTRKERDIPLFSKLRQCILDDPYSRHEINRSKQQIIEFDPSNVMEIDYRRENKYVFGKPDGTKFSTNFVSKAFKECLRKAGMDEKFHFHCLRHTALTNMANAGVPPFMIKDFAGHSDIKTTQGYVHPSLNEMRNWLENMDFDSIGAIEM